MTHRFLHVLIVAATLTLSGCMSWEYGLEEDIHVPDGALFVVNEGNFQYGNASLSYYDPATDEVQHEAFIRSNGFKLGDVAQSMVVRQDVGWIVVNHSHVVFAVDATTLKERGRITNLTSPRYIHFVSDDKAYISQLWDNRITIVDPRRYQITGYIEVPDMTMETGSTEQMVQLGRYVYCNCWSYQQRIIKIDTETDQIVGQLTVGLQPKSLCADRYGRLWTITDGGLEDSPYGHEAPRLWRIDPVTLQVEASWTFPLGSDVGQLQINTAGDRLYWINGDVWSMDVLSEDLPESPLIASRATIYYALTVSPYDGDVYVADAIDYQQAGMVYRYTPQGQLVSSFYSGIIPGAFAWK